MSGHRGWERARERPALADAGHRVGRGAGLLDFSLRAGTCGDRRWLGLDGGFAVSGLWLVGGRFCEELVEAAGEVALEAAQRAFGGLALGFVCVRGTALVVGSCWARVIAMMCSAWLSWRSPPRLSRCWVR